MNAIDTYLSKFAPEKSAFAHFLIQEVLKLDAYLTLRSSFGLPFIYGKKGICYFNIKKNGVDVGFMYGHKLPPRPEFIAEKRVQVRSLFFELEKDVDLTVLKDAVKDAILFDLQ